MVLTNDRAPLDTALAENLSVCVLLGVEDSEPGRVHGCMEVGEWGEESWHRWYLVTDPNLLTTDERDRWFGRTGNDYAFLGRTTKATTSNGVSETDLLDGGECDYITYIEKFAEADLQ